MSLGNFHPTVRAWFESRYGAPTEIQELAWPRIAAGAHTLVVAPTGSGKTLTGFLWPLDRLLTGAWEGDGVRVLYVSPLKALNADIERNLEEPLAGLAAALEAAGEAPRPVRVGVRSGDTPPAERQRMLRRPPEILITTPESLNLLLLGKRAEALFRGLRLVLLDEIHAVAGSKRGTHLVTAVERLTRVAGEFQRVAISATVEPPRAIARFVGGARLERGAGGEARFVRRPVEIVQSRAAKRYELAVRHVGKLEDDEAATAPDALWLRLADELRARIAEVRSTLVFTNSRRLAEKLTRLVNDAAGREVAWSHHGSLSRELRTTVERRLKRGELPALVATSSLELGIDVGALDRVLLAQAPRSFASAAQRIGRSGHRVGEVSRAIFYPTHARDVVDCAVVARAVLDGDLEPIAPISAPLDLLAQTLLAATAHERWTLDDLYDFVRTAEPYRELARRSFDLVIEMLAGRYEETRVAELKPRIALDRLTGTVQALPGTARLLARAGGTIPDRGYFQLRLEESNAKLGELDEEFVWERSVGDSFVLGAQAWRIRRITANEVFVSPARGGASLAPFWRADARDRGSYASKRVARFFESANARLDDPAFRAELESAWALEPVAAATLLADLAEAREALGGTLPHRHQVVIEECEERRDPSRRAVLLYTFWGGSVNRPLAMALAAAWEEREGEPIEANADDDAILLVLPEGADPRALLLSIEPERLDTLLRARLETSGFFGAHFRQNAQRALLLPRAGPAKRTPLWLSRQNAKRLLEAVSRFDDFPLLAETWRTCLRDEFELDVLRTRLAELASGAIRVAHVRTPRPSPLAANLVWRRTNELMYEDDVPSARRGSALSGDLVREIALAGESARIPPELVEAFRRRAQRLLPDYPPTTALELVEWAKERLWIPADEWAELLAALERERPGLAAELAPEVTPQLVRLELGAAGVAARDTLLATRGAAAWLFRASRRAARSRSDGTADRIALSMDDGGGANVAKAPPRGGREGAVPLRGLAGAANPSSEIASGELVRGAGRSVSSEPPRRANPGTAAADGPAEPGATFPGSTPSMDLWTFAGVEDLDPAKPAAGAEEGEVEGLAEFLADWLRFYGAVRIGWLAALLGVSTHAVEEAVARLASEEKVVAGELVEGETGPWVARLANFETLSRWRRAGARPELEPLPVAALPLFLAEHQGLTGAESGVEGLQRAFDRLFGFVAPAAAWEGEILPARCPAYQTGWLDGLFEDHALRWVGAGRERVAFALEEELPLIATAREGADDDDAEESPEGFRYAALEARLLDQLATHPRGLELGEIAAALEASWTTTQRLLWRLAWRGLVANESMRPLRAGALGRFEPEAEPAARASGGAARGGRSLRRWTPSRAPVGRWRRVEVASAEDALAEESLARERARLVLDRYGVVFRELLAQESTAFSWARLARALRVLELSGEIVSGHFFTGVSGLQFATPDAVRRLRAGLAERAIWWVNGLDPASPCGLGLPGLKGALPRRVAGSHLVYRGADLLLVSRASGREIEIDVAPDDPVAGELTAPFRTALTRAFDPAKAIDVETINGEPAGRSPYLAMFAGFSVTREGSAVRLRRRYGGAG